MPSHSEIRSSPYSPAQLFALVLDVEKYPEFLPWCRAARITQRAPDHFIGELVISFHHLTESYSSKVMPIDGPEPRIEVTLVKGPFKTLANHWRFVTRADGGCDIHFAVEFEFKSRLLEKLIGGIFGRAVEKMVGAFTARADALYRPNPL